MRRPFRPASFFTTLLTLLAVAAPAFAGPHGGFSDATTKCLLCHSLHTSAGEQLLAQQDQKRLCYQCHDGTGSTYDARSEFGESVLGTSTVRSSHPVPGDTLVCDDCHTPHRGPDEGNPMSLSVGESKTATTSAVCGGCHGTGSTLPGGDHVTPLAGTPHETSVPAPPSGTDIRCLACHRPHGSDNAALARTSLVDPWGVTRTVDTSPSQNPLCLACHAAEKRGFSGENVYAGVKHSTVASSSKAATTYPSVTARAGECRNCHEPHGRVPGEAYTRASGQALCLACHDAPGVSYPAGYSYRGGTAYAANPHGSTETTLAFATLVSDSDGFAAWESSTLPTPSSPGTPIDRSRTDAMRVADDVRCVTSLASVTGELDYQTYRFKAPAGVGALETMRLTWVGYGEEVPGYDTTLTVWNRSLGGGAGAWETLRSGLYGTQTTLTASIPGDAEHVDASGYVWVMASTRHARRADILSGPTVTYLNSSTVQVRWTTLGKATSWVDVGPDSFYGSNFGSDVMTSTHDVLVAASSPGVFHYRIRTMDANGVESVTPDAVFRVPAPTLNPVPDTWETAPVTLTWNAPADASGEPYTYRVQYGIGPTTYFTSSSYSAETSLTVAPGNGVYWWRVEALDKDGVPTAWSADGTFTRLYVKSSCPILYTWDGSGFRFLTDVMGFGNLGLESAPGVYRFPPPVEDSSIDGDRLKPRDGKYELRLKNEKNEIEFVDALSLKVVDHPAGTRVLLNDYDVPDPTRIYTVRDPRPVSGSWSVKPVFTEMTTSGVDVTADVAREDGVYAPYSFLDDNRYEFDLGDLRDAARIKLVVGGWTKYLDQGERRDVFASGKSRAERAIDVMDADGNWVKVDKYQVIPGYTKTVVYDLTGKFPPGVDRYKVRLRGGYRTFLDFVGVDTSAEESVTVTELKPSRADLSFKGLSLWSEDGLPGFRYDEIIKTDPKLHVGRFTRFGDVKSLLEQPDDMFVVMDSGDDIALEFDEPAPPAPGWERSFVIHTDGWHQENTETVDPMPFHAMSNWPYRADEHYPDDPEHQAYLAEWQTRVHLGETASYLSSETPSPAFLDGAASYAAGALRRVTASVRGLLAPAEAPAADPGADRSIHTDVVSLQVAYDGGVQAGRSCTVCHNPHGQVSPDGRAYPALTTSDELRTCTGNGNGACHSSSANSADGVNVYARVNGATANSRHDLSADAQAASGSRIACSSCHNPHKETTRERFADPDSISETMTSPANDYLGPAGDVFVLLGAEHDAVAPVISNFRVDNTTPTVPVFLWDTNEQATSWVDIGETASYELGSVGATLPLASAHSVTSLEMTPGVVYHYRVRSADALGNERFTGDATLTVAFPPPAPSIPTTPPDAYQNLPVSVTTTWTAVSSPDGDPVQYLAEMWDVSTSGGPYLRYTSGWSSSTTWTLNVSYSGNLMVRVRARDSVHQQAVSAYSNQPVFNITVPSGTCPYLFTFDGSGYAFESDLYGTGKLGMKSKGAYLMPQPEDHLLLRAEPVPVAGAYDLRLVEERLEVDYLDELKLYAVDAVAGRDVVTEMPTLGEAPLPGLPAILHTVARGISGAPSAVHVNAGADVTAKLDRSDGDMLVLNEDRNAGFDYQTVELDLSASAGAPQTKIVIDGHTMFPNSAAGTARSSTFAKRTKLEVLEDDGTWRSVPSTELALPKPMEFEKPYVVDLTGVLEGSARRVRLSFLFKTYLDSIKVDTTLDEPVRLTEAPMLTADLRRHGFDGVTDPDDELYEYVYGEANDSWQYFPGLYTRFGEVSPLLAESDDEFVIYGGGDEIALRFAQALPPAPGFERRWLVSTRGYYKDIKTDLPKTVEPLPSAAMSGYPYPAGESYPADAEHQAYRDEWNTRVEPSLAKTSDTVQHLTLPEGGTRTVGESGGEHSLDSDRLTLTSNGLGRDPFTYAAAAGWESATASTTPPTPASPGAAAGGATLSRLGSEDGVYWRTDLTGAVDRRYNWQVVKFSVPGAEVERVSELRVLWSGHGEPTAGYKTSVSLWNHRTSAWESTSTRTGAGTDVSIGRSAASVPSAQCLRCHDGAAPLGVTVPAGVANIAASWPSALHGPSVASGGAGGGLIPEYTRNQAPDIQCAVCHDPHGSSNAWHFPTTVKDRTGISVANGTQAESLCAACHVGTAWDYHRTGCSCHYDWDGEDPTHMPRDFWSTDCLSCHGHGRTYVHPSCGHCHVGSWKTL